MICENCGKAMTRGAGFWVCLGCGHQANDLEGVALPTKGLDGLPSVLALPWAEFQSEPHAVMRLHRLCDTVEILTRFLAIIALGELRRSLDGLPLPKDLLEVLQPRIERPTFGQWRDMLVKIVASLPSAGTLIPELSQFVSQELLPRMDNGHTAGEEALRRNIVQLRNTLAHGGAMRQAAAKTLLQHWEPWLEEMRYKLDFLESGDHFPSRTELLLLSEEAAHRLRGIQPSRQARISNPADLTGHVVLFRNGGYLDLWPLLDYRQAETHTLEGTRQSSERSPLVYFRRESDRLLYAALAGDLAVGERLDVLESFRKLFELQTRASGDSPLPDFEEEIDADSQAMVGRAKEIEQSKAVLKKTQRGVLWIGGPGGVGKSFLMARLAQDLRGDSRKTCRIVWRFKASDQRRCNRVAFLRYAQTKLGEWLLARGAIREVEPPNGDSVKLERQFVRLLDEVAKLKAPTERASPPRVLLMLDGLDEIARLDRDFAELPLQWVRDNVVWLCAGREDAGLEETFRTHRCRHVFKQGLPVMTDQDIRAMLLDSGSGRLKYDFLELDGESGEEVTNGALEAIVNRAGGLPLYVRHVIEDLRTGHFQLKESLNRLAQGLKTYYDDLVRRLSVSDSRALLTQLLVTLAWAKEPLGDEVLQLFLERRRVLVTGHPGNPLLRNALSALQPMVRQQRGGWVVYHERFREHIQKNEAGLIGQQNKLVRDEFVELVEGWKSLDENNPLFGYLVRWGISHAFDVDNLDLATQLLTDRDYLRQHIRFQLELLGDPIHLRLWLRCECKTPLEIGTFSGYSDSTRIAAKAEVVIVPATTIKGWLRARYRQIADLVPFDPRLEKEIFDPGGIYIENGRFIDENVSPEFRTRISIDSRTRSAKEASLWTMSAIPAGSDFTFSITLKIADSQWFEVPRAIALALFGISALGTGRVFGYGLVETRVSGYEILDAKLRSISTEYSDRLA